MVSKKGVYCGIIKTNKMETKKIKNLEIGDVFYYDIKDTCNYDSKELDYEQKIDNLVYGTDIIGIVDDIDSDFIYLNYYGMTCFKNDNIEVKVICHYSDIIK